MTSCDHNDRHHQPFSILGKLFGKDGWWVTGMDYLTIMLYDGWETYYVFLSTGIRKYVNAAKAVSTLYDENVAAGVEMEDFYAGETIVANGKFKLIINNNEGANNLQFTLLNRHDGCSQSISMSWQGVWNYKGVARWQMHYVRFEVPSCYKCTTCGMLGDFQTPCWTPSVIGCDGTDHNFGDARGWAPGSSGFDQTGWTWQKEFVDGDSCPDSNARGAQVDMDKYCDEDVQQLVIAKCQEARDDHETCCRNLDSTGTYCDELQESCNVDVCIFATDEPESLDKFIDEEFTTPIDTECGDRGVFGPVPVMLYEFNGDLTETMSGGDSAYTLQTEGDVFVDDGALVCDGSGDYVYNSENIEFTFTAHSMEVLVEVDNLNSQGGGTIAIDGLYNNAGGYTHTKFDSIVYNELNNNKWILGSEYFDRTDTSGTDTAESTEGVMVHLVAVYNPEENVAKLYRNGVEEMSYDPGDFLTAGTMGEGWRVMFCQRHLNAGLNDFEGKIMFGAVYDYALSDEDVEQLYNAKVVELDVGDGDSFSVEAVDDELLPGESLLAGQGLMSVDSRYLAVMQPDGNFVMYDLENDQVILQSNTDDGTKATFGDDGNFIVYNDEGRVRWHSGLTSDDPARLVMGVNGELIMYDSADNTVWTSEEHDPVPVPSPQPTPMPTESPTEDPTPGPTRQPTSSPSADPTVSPTTDPTTSPSEDPTASPTAEPTTEPSTDPTSNPTTDPTEEPTTDPTTSPTTDPTAEPTADPTTSPTTDPTTEPTKGPTTDPTVNPTADPTVSPTADPTTSPTTDPTTEPTTSPTTEPTANPST